MWCVKCHTFWHWDSMTIIEARGQIPHNPDHREWLQRTGGVAREIGDIPCGGLPTGDELHTALIRDFAATHVLSPFAEHLLNAADAVHLAQRMRAQYPVTWNEAQLTESLPRRLSARRPECCEVLTAAGEDAEVGGVQKKSERS